MTAVKLNIKVSRMVTDTGLVIAHKQRQQKMTDYIRNQIDREYFKLEEIMKAMPDYMTALERNQRIAVAHAQRGKIQGLELALSIIEQEKAA